MEEHFTETLNFYSKVFAINIYSMQSIVIKIETFLDLIQAILSQTFIF